jgi:hypothetical protein
MLRLSGVFPDLFVCSSCSRPLQAEDLRFLAPGFQAVICGDCDHRGAAGMLTEVVNLVFRILKTPLDNTGSGSDRAVRNLLELNQYWIRLYSER